MSNEPQWQSVIDLVINHPTQPQILVQQEGEQWRLPHLRLDSLPGGLLTWIKAEVQRHLGLTTTVVRQVYEQSDESQQRVYQTFLLENHTTVWTPPAQMQWIAPAAFDQTTLTRSEQQQTVMDCLREITTGVTPPLRAAWQRPGWFRQAESWIHQQLQHLGQPATGPVEQVKLWFLSCILRVPTTQGMVYFKATNGSPLMVNEALLTQRLAQLFPAVMPQPLALDAARDWVLLADFGPEVGWDAAVETREAALVAFAQLQIASAPQVDELLAHGCIDRRLPKLAEQIAPLLTDPALMAMIDVAQQQELLAVAPRLAALCQQMAQYKVPATLVHGDLHMSNVARRGEQFVFFDWSDACIAHPFLDMIAILHEKDIALQTRLRDAYLATWTQYEPMERLLELWQMAYPLCALHQAVSYRYIAHHSEHGCTGPMMGWAMPFWFGKMLEALVSPSV
jgi:hypothetical protein